MAKKIRKNKNIKIFFLVLGLLLAIGILVFSNYLSKTTTSTDTKAAGRKQCSDYKAINCPKNLGCVPSGKWCKFVGVGNNDTQQTTSNTVSGRSPVKTSAGYCLSGLDCNVGWYINGKYTPPQSPTGAYSCPQPFQGNKIVFCCPPGTHRDDVTKGPGFPGTCVK